MRKNKPCINSPPEKIPISPPRQSDMEYDLASLLCFIFGEDKKECSPSKRKIHTTVEKLIKLIYNKKHEEKENKK